MDKRLGTFLLFLTLGTAACGDVVRVKDANISIPGRFKNRQSGDGFVLTEKYWESWKDPELNALIEKGLKNNSDLKAAAFRIQRDFALAGGKKWDLIPSLSANPRYQRLMTSKNTGQPIDLFGIPRNQNLYTLPLDFSYEIDFWGRVRNRVKAARAQARGTYYQYLDTSLLLTSEIAKTYFALRENRLKTESLERIVARRNAQAELAASLRQAGFNPEQEMLRQGELLNQALSDLEMAKAERLKNLSALAILVNENPSEFEFQPKALDLAEEIAAPPETLPSEWIRTRPDILASEQNILAQNALAKSALAEFFPKFTFNARFGVESLSLSNLVSRGSTFFGLGPTVSIPLLDIGRNLANYRAQKSEAHVSLEEYKKTVLTAFKDVEDRLAEFNDARAEFENYLKSYRYSDRIAALDRSKRRAGFLSEKDFLETETQAENALLMAAMKKRQLLASTVDLLRSFGGGLRAELLLKADPAKIPTSRK
ncbi:MAG: TolC family protein [bacterium]